MSRVILLLMAAQLALAQGGPGIEGNWMGTLDTGSMLKLRVVLKVSRSASGALSAKLDSPDQGGKDMPVSTITLDGSSLRFMFKGTATFEGALHESEIVGQWKQNGAALPLTLRRIDQLPETLRPQDPKKPYPYTEEEVVYENKASGSKLAGTLTTPPGEGPFPAVLLITGSGQQDRNESLMGHRPFLVLADHLTRNGIAVLRVDDRGIGGSTGDMKNATTLDFAGDVEAGVAFLKTRVPRIDTNRIGLIGHSEGGVIAPMVAARSKDVAFIVLLAGTGVNGEEVLRAQAAGIAKVGGASDEAIGGNLKIQDQVCAIVKEEEDTKARETRLEALKNKLSIELRGSATVLEAQFKAAASPWFRFFLIYDPAHALRKVECPVLALSGELDLQVPPGQNLPAIVKALEEGGSRDYTIVKLPKLNHLFQTSRTGSPLEYSQIEETMSPVALETISDWILRRRK